MFGTFSTEFPVEGDAGMAGFVAQVVTWLRGAESSTVITAASSDDLDGDAPHLRTASGEELRFRRLASEAGSEAIGFRHDLPDDKGCIWRTEAVLLADAPDAARKLIRVRTQCLAATAGARLNTPRKPYLIKSLLAAGWGATDGLWRVADHPHWLSRDDLATATMTVIGEASECLPCIYVSATGDSAWCLTRDQIEKLAFDLGGVAHVVVEPSREFSFQLRDESQGRNPYGGTVAAILPGRGPVRRWYLGPGEDDPAALQQAVREAVGVLRSQMPTKGWDWSELQEQALRLQRQREKSKLSQADMDLLYEEEIASLKEQVTTAHAQLESLRGQAGDAAMAAGAGALDPSELHASRVLEIYPGEIGDRIRLAARLALKHGGASGLGDRSRAVLESLAKTAPAPRLKVLLEDLKRVTKDGKRMAGDLADLLSRHGYETKSQKNHVVLEARSGYGGLETLTVPKTPSDGRALANMRTQAERSLGLREIQD